MHFARLNLSATWLALAFCSAALGQGSGSSLRISVEQRAYKPGDKVFATLEAMGSVTLENDFKAVSQEVKVNGKERVELGAISGPGVFVVKALSGTQKSSAVVFVAPGAEKGTLDFTVCTGPVKPPEVSGRLMEKFVAGMTRDRLVMATKAAVKDWLKDNVASLGTTTTVCLVCFAPGGQFACGACASSGASNTIDLGIEVLKKLVDQIEKDGVITKDEATKLRTLVTLGEGLVAIHDVKQAGTKLEKSLEALKFAVKEAFTEGNVKILIGNGADEAKKAAVIIRLLK